jgi:CDP-glycerol glycerophosphotransferase
MRLTIAVIAWLLLGPLTVLCPRDPRRALVIGRDGGKFVDNAKYSYIALLNNPSLHVSFAGNADAVATLKAAGVRASDISGLRTLWLCLRAGTVIFDSIDWGTSMRHVACRGARLVQLWHGVPLKEIELSVFRKRLRQMIPTLRPLLRLYKWVIGRHATFDVLLSTSSKISGIFSTAFSANRISTIGYPRNDVLVDPVLRLHPLVQLNVDPDAIALIAKHRLKKGAKVGLYAPTFRRELADPFATGTVDIEAMSREAESEGLLLLVKLHPWMRAKITDIELPGIFMVPPETDVYPLMHEVDFLITDYSSIYFDYLLLDRPIVFYPYDLDRYIRDDRALLFDYSTVTPGPKARDMNALLDEIKKISRGDDAFATEREQIRRLVFDHVDANASKRLLSELFP